MSRMEIKKSKKVKKKETINKIRTIVGDVVTIITIYDFLKSYFK
ncbi:MAG: hypothetical protein RR657_02745 [Peptostreptococcaceae bacterium]